MDPAAAQGRSVRKPSCCQSLACGACAVFWMALVSLALALLAPLFLQHMIDQGITDGTVINSESASGYQHFLNYSYESENRFIVTFFNISNAAEVLEAPNVKPRLEEVGPFVYTAFRNRSDVEFEDGGDTVSYRQHFWIEFNEKETMEQTKGKYNSDKDVKITTINVLFNGMRVQVGRSYWHMISDLLLWKTDYARLFEHRTPVELIQGYNVELDLMGLHVNINFPGLFANHALNKDPDMVKKSKINTGQSDPKATFQFVEWREEKQVATQCPYGMMHIPFDQQCKVNPYPCCGQFKKVPVWDTTKAHGEFDEDANAVVGTMGDQFGPGLHAEKEQVLVFFDLAQRAMAMVTTPGEGTYDYKGVQLRKFRPDRNLVWGNVSERKANARYYQVGPGGLMNLTMIFGADIFISLPHFLEAEPRLLEEFEGLNPSKELHDLYIGTEPYTGITMTEQQRAMVSIKVNRVPGEKGLDKGWFPNLEDRTLYVPIAWFNQQAMATSTGTDQVKTMYLALTAKKTVVWIGIGLGVVTVLCAVALGLQARKHKVETAPNALLDGQTPP